MKSYSQSFYINRHEKTVYSANTILSILLERIPSINSVIDVGCGVGTWLSVLLEKGIKEIQGIDGNWVDRNLLVIPQESFEQVDLSKSVELPKRYDLAISLEVAEHLPPERAEAFVSLLTGAADTVLFSAAIPFQGGTNHINEQWPFYWAGLFNFHDYEVHDFIRPKIWNDSQIPFWYRQNILLFTKRLKSDGIQPENDTFDTQSLPLSIVHPDLYLSKIIPNATNINVPNPRVEVKHKYKHH
jgi:hypothetical protein